MTKFLYILSFFFLFYTHSHHSWAQSLHFNFPNINKVNHYIEKKKLKKIKKLYKEEKWDILYKELHQYINNFGIKDFQQQIDLLLMMAEVSSYTNQEVTIKQILALIVKNYAGEVDGLLKNYNVNSFPTEYEYANLEHYYYVLKRESITTEISFKDKKKLEIDQYINSSYDDYGITLGENTDTIYFSSDRIHPQQAVIADINNYKSEDIFFSFTEINGWSKPTLFLPTKSRYKEGSPFLSKQYFFFSRCYAPDGMGNCDLYILERDGEGGWDKAKNLGPLINSPQWESHPSLSSTGDTLFFSSDRAGGFGNADIYFSVKKNGEWGKSQNIGPLINTKGNELSPFFHPNYNVLYFSSDGQIFSIGGCDIYKSSLKENRWTEPKNLGPFINNKYNDFYFAIDKNAKWFFFAKSKKGNFQDNDIHCFLLPMEAKPDNLVLFSGKAIEPTTGEIFEGTVTIIELKEKTPISPKRIRADGSFEFELLNKRDYLIVIEGDNFFRIKEIFYLDGNKNKIFYTKDVKKKISFQSIDFEKNKANILTKMENNIHLIINYLKNHPFSHLEITGHTDADGDSKMNLELSIQRAENIKKYIKIYGKIEANRIHVEGEGNTNPIVLKEITEKDKKLNRRVEFRIIDTKDCPYHKE